MVAVTIWSDFGAQENQICHRFHFSPFYLPWSDGTRCHDLHFQMLSFKNQLFQSPLSRSSRGSLIPLHFLPLTWYHLHIWGCCYFSQQSWLQLVIHPPNILHDVLCIEVKQTGWQYTALIYSFPNLELASCSMFSSKCCFLTRIQASQETGKVICSWHSKVFFQVFPPQDFCMSFSISLES